MLAVGNTGESDSNGLLSPENWDSVEKILQHSHQIGQDMDGLDKGIDNLNALHAKQLSQMHISESDEVLNTKTRQIQTKMRTLKEEIMIMHKHLTRNKEQSATVGNRIIKEQVNRHITKLTTLGEKFENEQIEYKDKTMRNYTSYLGVLGIRLSGDEIDEAVDAGHLSKRINEKILGMDQTKSLRDKVRQRTDGILTLEKSIRDLYEMLHDLHILVGSQNGMLNNIGINVGQSAEYATKARDAIKAARKSKRRAQRKKIGLFIAGIVLAPLVLIGIL